MTFILNYTSIIRTERETKSRFGGSSKYRVRDDELIDISEERKKNPKYQMKKRIDEINKEIEERTFSEKLEFESEQEPKKKENEEPKRIYKLTNSKSKVRKNCYAFSRLEKSKRFFAFYSISFPEGISDETGYKLFNTWLTRCRKKQNLKSYLWVAERQKNGTIHFHLLTNDYMKIRTVNGFMATSLTNEKKRGNEALKEVDTAIYNGVDVKKVKNGRKSLIGYLTKYVTKNEIEFYRLPWHCSRDVSRLFTSINIPEEPNEESDKYFDRLPYSVEHYSEIKEGEYFRSAGFKFCPDESLYKELDGLNEIIYNN